MEWFAAPEYWLAREVLQRGIAAIYVIAFIVAARQFRALIGDGMLPVPRVSGPDVVSVPRPASSTCTTPTASSPTLLARAALAAARSSPGSPTGAAVGGDAAVAGAVGAVPVDRQRRPDLVRVRLGVAAARGRLPRGLPRQRRGTAPPLLVLWLLRWLLFRVEFGAGLIKMRGDRCWRDLTCLYYHHETQPMPGPLSWFFHHLPKPLHRVEVAGNHFAQLVVPFVLFAPQPVAASAAAIIVVTQLWLVLSRQLRLAELADDRRWPAARSDAFVSGAGLRCPTRAACLPRRRGSSALVLAVTALVVVLSYWPVRNLLSRRQLMNASFNPLHLVNTYGAFGSVTRTRHEVVIEGTDERLIDRAHGVAGVRVQGQARRRAPAAAPVRARTTCASTG